MVALTNAVQQLPILLLISLDGFRHDYLNPSLTPNLYELSEDATVGAMRSLYISKTFPNHFSIVTGLYEDEHEIVNNKMFDPRSNKTFHAGNTDPDWWDRKSNHVPIWIANELLGRVVDGRPRYSGSMMYPGSETPFQGNMYPTHLEKFNYLRNWTNHVDIVMSWLLSPEKPANLVTIYFDHPDNMAHRHGPWANETLDALKKVDSAIGYLMQRLEETNLSHRTNILFVSDHGMADVDEVAYLSDIMDVSKFELVGASPNWAVFVKPEFKGEKDKIYLDLTIAANKFNFTIFKREEIPPEYHYSKTPRIGDFSIIADRHRELARDRPAAKKGSRPGDVGNHGWDPNDSDMWPLFMARGPAFKRNYTHQQPFPNIDLFPLMVHLLNLPEDSVPSNGSLANVIDILATETIVTESNELLETRYFYLIALALLSLTGLVFTLLLSITTDLRNTMQLRKGKLDDNLIYYLNAAERRRLGLIVQDDRQALLR